MNRLGMIKFWKISLARLLLICVMICVFPLWFAWVICELLFWCYLDIDLAYRAEKARKKEKKSKK